MGLRGDKISSWDIAISAFEHKMVSSIKSKESNAGSSGSCEASWSVFCVVDPNYRARTATVDDEPGGIGR